MTGVTYDKTRTGNDLLVYDGYEYLFNTKNRWRCRNKHSCTVQLKYDEDVVTINKPHNHSRPRNLDGTEMEDDEAPKRKPSSSKKSRSKKRRHTREREDSAAPPEEPDEEPEEAADEEPSETRERTPQRNSPRKRATPQDIYPSFVPPTTNYDMLPFTSTSHHTPESSSEEDRFGQYVGAMLKTVKSEHRARYMQAIKLTIAKLDVEIASQDAETPAS